ncbi:MAG: aminoglycoside phosphotransferase family protein [Moorea sp. SIO3G5]|nr:aminoglycoside phosphotransferase family protein [Moorena sp. SIO3G5]
MAFLLSSKNVFEYLIEQGICTEQEQAVGEIEPKAAKNFNLLLTLPEGRKLLVKQEPYHQDGKTVGEFLKEWRSQEFLRQFPEVSHLGSWLPEVLHFDPDNSIIVFNYLSDYQDLTEFYGNENVFPNAIASSIGAMVASIHRATLGSQDYQDFFSEKSAGPSPNQAQNLTKNLERISPKVFSQVPPDGLKFFALYQRYDSLGKAIAELSNSFDACCLVHNDLKLNNILLPNDWEQATSAPKSDGMVGLRLIDWERSSWGDPAFDIGSIINSYLTIWLGSLAVSNSIDIEEALNLAMTPLEQIQPSIAALIRTYCDRFPEILERYPNFLQRVMQFSGLALIQTIQSIIEYQKSFGNTGICMLQVAKSLLCRPEASIRTVFGIEESELIGLNQILHQV